MNHPRLGRALPLSLLVIALLAATASAEATRSPSLNALDARAPLASLAVREQAGVGQVIDLFLTGDVADADLEALGVQTHSRLAGGIRTVTVPVARLTELARVPGLTRITASHLAHKLNNVSVRRVNATPGFWTHSGAGVFAGDAGQGVIVGVVDTGIDWSHDDFKNPNGTTRILYIWDQNDAGGPNPPEFAYGTQWTAANINASTPRETDADGHGTHVSGTAAGDGSATGNAKPAFQFTGMAPRADMIVVATTFSTADIVDGVNYIFQKAQALGKNAVVNLSLGTQFGAHDGTETFDTSINALTGPGRIVCAAAGNDGGSGIHARQLVPSGGNQTVTFDVPAYTPLAGATNDFVVIDAYYPASANMRVTLTSPGPSPVTIGPVSLNGTSQNTGSAAGALYVENGSTPSPSGDRNIYIQIYDANAAVPPRAGTWTITLQPVTTSASTALDLWLADFSLGSAGASAVFTSDVDDHDLVSSPGSAAQVITAGAWITKGDWPSIDGNSYGFTGLANVGDLANYSSPGPLRNGAQKPDIAAPGSAIVSSFSTGAFGITQQLVNPDGVHYTETGTSMASPHVAGAVALLLEAQPGLTPDQIKAYLATNAIVDDSTGTVPNAFWGHGKLHLLNGDLSPPTVNLTSPDGGEQWPTQSPQDITWTASDNLAVTGIDLALSLDSGATWSTIAAGLANSGTYAWTVPTTQSTHAKVRISAHDAAGNLGTDQSAAVFTIVDTSTVIPPPYPKPEIVVVQPNPFNLTTTIGLGLPAQGPAKIVIYSVTGRRVKTLADGTFSAGYHPFTWDGRDDDGRKAGSGIYFLKLTSGGTTQSKRIAMVR